MKKLLFFVLTFVVGLAHAAAVHEHQYGVGGTFNFELYNTDGTLDVDEVDGGAEVSVACDESAEGTATNDFVDEGTFYSITLTVAELTCARVTVVVAATDTNVFYVETYGDLSAQDKSRGVASGIAQASTTTTIKLAAATNSADNYFVGKPVCITEGTGAGQCRLITIWVQSTDVATVHAVWDLTPSTDSGYIVQSGYQDFLSTAAGVIDANVASFDANVIDSAATDSTFLAEINAEADTALVDYDAATGTELDLLNQTFLNCEVNTANFAGSTSTFACILTDLASGAVTQASNDLEGLQIVVTSGAQIREARFINDTTWDGVNSELQMTISRALPATLADAVTVIVR